MTTPDIVIVIGVMTTSAVTIINALYSARGRREVMAKTDTVVNQNNLADRKLDSIHTLANSRLTEALAGLATARRRIDELEAIVKQLERRDQPFVANKE